MTAVNATFKILLAVHLAPQQFGSQYSPTARTPEYEFPTQVQPLTIMTPQRKMSFREKLRERLTKRPTITSERRVACRLEILQNKAQELDSEETRLQERAVAFSGREQMTPSPTKPPAVRDALFERSEDAPPSQYETQLKAYNSLLDDWRIYNLEVREFEDNFKHFSTQMSGMRKKVHLGPGKPMGRNEHDFEALENALRNLDGKRLELKQAVDDVQLPAVKPVKGRK